MDASLIQLKDRIVMVVAVILTAMTLFLLYQYYGTTSFLIAAGLLVVYCAIRTRSVDATAPQPGALSRTVAALGLLIAVAVAVVEMFIAQIGLFRNPDYVQNDLYALLITGLVVLAVALWAVPMPAVTVRLPQLSKVKIRWVCLAASIALAFYAGVRASQDTTVAEQFAVWLLSIFLLALAFVRTPPLAEDRLRRWEWLLIIGLFVGALLVRGIDIGTIPYVMDGDEAHFAEIGTSTIASGWISSPFQSSFDSYTRLQSTLIAFCVSVLGASVAAARIPSVILGSLTIPAIYLLGRELYNWKLGFAAALFTLGWAFHAQFSRLGLNQAGDPCFGAFAFFFLIRGIRRGSAFDYAMSGIMLALSQMFYLAGMQYPIIMLAFLLWMAWRQRDLILRQWRLILIVPLTTLIVYGPRLIYLFQQQETMFGHMQPNIITGGFLSRAIAAGNVGGFIVTQLQGSFLGLFSIPDGMTWYGPGSNLLSPVGGPLLLIGLVAALLLLKRYPMIALAVGWSFSAVFLGATLSGSPPSYQRYVAGVPGFALLIGLGIIAVSNFAATLLTPRLTDHLFQTLCLVAGAASLIFYVTIYIPAKGYLLNPPVWTGQQVAFDMREQLKAGRQTFLIDTFGSGLDGDAPVIKYLMAEKPFGAIASDETIADGLDPIADTHKEVTLYVAPQRMAELKIYLNTHQVWGLSGTQEVDFLGQPAYFEVKLN